MQRNEEAPTQPRRRSYAETVAKVIQALSFAAYLPALYLAAIWLLPEYHSGGCGTPAIMYSIRCVKWLLACLIAAAIGFATPGCRGAGFRFLICGFAPHIIGIAHQAYDEMGWYD